MPYKFGWRARKLPFTRANPCWCGSMWFVLSRHATAFVLKYMSDHPEFVEHYRRTVIPDESMISTLICNASNMRVDNREIHYTRWSEADTSHADVFGPDDLPELVAAPHYFARKFDIDRDPDILDRLDEIIAAKVLNVTSLDHS
jgi:hypothetical protein